MPWSTTVTQDGAHLVLGYLGPIQICTWPSATVHSFRLKIGPNVDIYPYNMDAALSSGSGCRCHTCAMRLLQRMRWPYMAAVQSLHSACTAVVFRVATHSDCCVCVLWLLVSQWWTLRLLRFDALCAVPDLASPNTEDDCALYADCRQPHGVLVCCSVQCNEQHTRTHTPTLLVESCTASEWNPFMSICWLAFRCSSNGTSYLMHLSTE